MWCLQCLVDWLAADGAHVVCGQHSCPELSAPPAVADALVAPLAHVASHVYGAQGVMDLSTTIFAVGLLECRYRGSRIRPLPCLVGAPHHLRMPLPDCQYPYPGFVSWVPSAGFEPASTRGHKEENPIKTRGRYDLPLIPTKAYRQADLSITASRKHGIGLPATLGYAHSDGSGRSVSDMPFGQDGDCNPSESGESIGGYK